MYLDFCMWGSVNYPKEYKRLCELMEKYKDKNIDLDAEGYMRELYRTLRLEYLSSLCEK